MQIVEPCFVVVDISAIAKRIVSNGRIIGAAGVLFFRRDVAEAVVTVNILYVGEIIGQLTQIARVGFKGLDSSVYS